MNEEEDLLEQFQNALMKENPDAKIERQFAGNKNHLNFSRGNGLWSLILVTDQDYKWVQKMDQLRHPNILQIIEIHPQPLTSVWGVKCEFIPVKTLATLVKKKYTFSEFALWKIMQQVASVLKTMHSKNIIHRGLCLDTIFVRKVNPSKHVTDIDIVLDFLTDSTSEQSVVASMMGEIDKDCTAPEVQHGKQYSPASDMYSLGALILKILKVDPSPKFPGTMRIGLTPKQLSPKLIDLLCRLVTEHIENRPSASSVWGSASEGQKVKAICSISSNTVPSCFCFEEGEELLVEKAYEDRVQCVNKAEIKGTVLSSAFW